MEYSWLMFKIYLTHAFPMMTSLEVHFNLPGQTKKDTSYALSLYSTFTRPTVHLLLVRFADFFA